MKKALFMTTFILCAVPVTAVGQGRPAQGPAQSDGLSINIGAGALLSPNYLGDDTYSLSAVPYIRVTHSDLFFASVQEGVGYNLIKQENFRAGPLMRLEFGRDEDGSRAFRIAGGGTDDLRGLGDIDTSFSLGGFAEIDLGDVTASIKLGQAVSGHDGLTGDIGLSYKGTVSGNGPPIIYSMGPRIIFGDDKYVSAQFGVNAAQSQASGLASF